MTVSDDCQDSPDRRVGRPARHSSTHAAITHPRREVATQACLGQHVEECTHGHLVVTWKARRPPRWAPRHVPWSWPKAQMSRLREGWAPHHPHA